MNQINDLQTIRSKEQIQNMKWALKRHCCERDYIMLLVEIDTGLRVGDLLKLKTNDLKNKKKLMIEEEKTQKSRQLNQANIYEEVQGTSSAMNQNSYFLAVKEIGNNTNLIGV